MVTINRGSHNKLDHSHHFSVMCIDNQRTCGPGENESMEWHKCKCSVLLLFNSAITSFSPSSFDIDIVHGHCMVERTRRKTWDDARYE